MEPDETATTFTARPQIRALFVDVDGTLVGGDNRISPGVRRALGAAHAHGCEVVICTGRARYTAEPIARQFPFPPGYAVTSNGGVAMHLGTGEVLHRFLLPIPIALEVVRAIHEAGAAPYVYEDATGADVEAARVLYHPERPLGHFATFPRFRPHSALLEDLPFTPISVSAFGATGPMRALVAHLREQLGGSVSIIESGSEDLWGVEVFAPGVSKQLGLETIAAHLDVNREEIMAIGDHVNDLEMLRWAGLGVAMGNALPQIQDAADWVTGRLDEDGVAQAIERFIL